MGESTCTTAPTTVPAACCMVSCGCSLKCSVDSEVQYGTYLIDSVIHSVAFPWFQRLHAHCRRGFDKFRRRTLSLRSGGKGSQ